MAHLHLADLEMAQIDMFDPKFAEDPPATYEKARRTCSWIAKYQFGYFLLDAQSMRDFLRDDERCREPNKDITQNWNAYGTAFERFNDHQLVALTGDAHKRIRQLVAPAFTPRAANL